MDPAGATTRQDDQQGGNRCPIFPVMQAMGDSTAQSIKSVLSRRNGVFAAVALALSAAAVLYLWAQGPSYGELYKGLSPEDSRAIIVELRKQNVSYRAEGGAISVPAERVHGLRMELAAHGLPRADDRGGAGGAGFEIFDHTGFGVSRFVQRVNYRRALQGELARTVTEMKEVESARVHLAIPEKSVFLEKEKKARASIIVRLRPGATLDSARAASIVHLVSGSLTNLNPGDVTVVDTEGRMWSRGSGEAGALPAARFDYRSSLERELEERVETMLERVVGPGRVVARVSAEVNTTRVERTEERFDPDGRVIRSEQREGLDARGRGRGEVINYEISKVTSRVVEPVGEVTRLTVSVVVDGDYRGDYRAAPAAAPTGAPASISDAAGGGAASRYVPRSAEELAGFTEMVKGAVGFSEKRGDKVTVTSAPFKGAPPGVTVAAGAAAPAAAGGWGAIVPAYLRPSIIKYGAASIVSLIALLFVVRPIASRLFENGGRRRGDGPGSVPAEPTVSTEPGEPGGPGGPGGESLVGGNLAALRNYAGENPRQVAMVIKKWLKEDVTDKASGLGGVDKAAILLMRLGEELAGRAAGHITPEEMRAIAGSMAEKDSVPFELGRAVADEFIETVRRGGLSATGSEFATRLVTGALDPESARIVVDQITRQKCAGSMESLRWMDASLVADVVKKEHPQIVALILAHLEPGHAAQVLSLIPQERVRAEVMLRVAALKSIPGDAVADLEEIIRVQMESAGASPGSAVEGARVAAEILNHMDPGAEDSIMETIEGSAPELASKIQDRIFAFGDLMGTCDSAMQEISGALSTEVLALALKGSEEALKERFMRNMPEPAAAALKAAMEADGPVSISDVEKARRVVTATARSVERDGSGGASYVPGKGEKKIV